MTDELWREEPQPSGPFYHAPIHHRHLTSTPSGFGLDLPPSGSALTADDSGIVESAPISTQVIEDDDYQPIVSNIIAANGAVILEQPAPPGTPHRMPPHPEPAHHRPVHVAGMAAARQLADVYAGPDSPHMPTNTVGGYPPYNALNQPLANQSPLNQQAMVDYRGRAVASYQQPAGTPQSQTQYQSEPQRPVKHKRHSHWPAALISALLAAILASVGTVAWLTYRTGLDLFAPAAPTHTTPVYPAYPGVDDSGESGAVVGGPGPIEGSTATNPYWQGVAAAVADSVVAIQASTTGGGSVGSGFIIDEAGHVLTNNHVIAGATNNQVQVTLADGRLYHADIVGGDTFTDLAVILLQNPPADLRPVALGNSDGLFVGDPVLAIGNPLGLANTATTGVISAINRPVTATGQDGLAETVTNAIQIDAAINPGNSGGPLFDHQGRVIGVTSSIASLSSGAFGGQSGSIGLGFAIPINLAHSISSQIIEHGEAEHPRLGVTLRSFTASADGVSRRGAQVQNVAEGTAAEAAGIQAGDVIIAFNGLPVAGSDSLTGFVRERRVGDVIELTLIRDGRVMTVTATLGAMNDVPAAPVPEPELTIPPSEDGSNDTEDESWLDEYGYPQD